MTDPSSFAKLVPGFDFLQSLVKNAGAALPGIGTWVAPTIDPAELEKRIEELRTVQFWLEQNARMLGATIQALEVQRMTLSTLKTMNVQMEDLRDSLQIRVPSVPTATPAAAAERESAKQPASEPAGEEAEPADAAAAETAASTSSKDKNKSNGKSQAGPAAPGVVDPMQWWGALTKQFTELATTAMKDTSMDAARTMAAAAMNKQMDAARGATDKAASTFTKPAGKSAARKSAAKKSAKATGKRGASNKKADSGA